MSSKSLLSNKAFNRLSVNRLDAISIRSDNISSASPSFLYSILFNFATFKRNNTGGQLIIGIDQKNSSVIQFSDRPFRQQKTITLYDFILLFFVNQQNSFSQDPPNVVLTHSNEQRTYKMIFSSITDKQLVYNLELLPGETHNLSEVSGRMSLFVDNQRDLLVKYLKHLKLGETAQDAFYGIAIMEDAFYDIAIRWQDDYKQVDYKQGEMHGFELSVEQGNDIDSDTSFYEKKKIVP